METLTFNKSNPSGIHEDVRSAISNDVIKLKWERIQTQKIMRATPLYGKWAYLYRQWKGSKDWQEPDKFDKNFEIRLL